MSVYTLSISDQPEEFSHVKLFCVNSFIDLPAMQISHALEDRTSLEPVPVDEASYLRMRSDALITKLKSPQTGCRRLCQCSRQWI